MRDRPYIAAGESPRPYSEIVAERQALDPAGALRARRMQDIEQLEAQAAAASDPEERKKLQCEAEGLRCLLDGR